MSRSSSRDPKVITAVEFLSDVNDMGHKEEELRKYLITRRSLTKAQVNEAFKIHYSRLTGSGDRPEVETGDRSDDPTFLLQEKRRVGGRLIEEFFRTEKNYLGVLTCLQEEYYKELCLLADSRKIVFTRAELKEIFYRVPDLLDFHRAFLKKLSKDKNRIAEVFVRVFSQFKQYVDYMKDCTKMVVKMRTHIHDKKLHRSLETIREKSKRKNDDMVDLLLVPLDRIMDYQQFLDKLHRWADNGNANYTWLAKAARRIGRIANYIGKYKGGISNKNEMNKVQQFLRKQCNILSPKRLIIRRGPMFRRTTSWPARTKHYIFFLFSDLLIWTSKKGDLQNVIRIRDCEVMEWKAKTNPEKKFKIAMTTKKKVEKVLLLECTMKRQRDQWFEAIQQEIKSAKSKIPNENITSNEEDLLEFLAMNPAAIDTTPPPGSTHAVEEAKCEEKYSPGADEDGPQSPGGPIWRYQTSVMFPKGEFHEEFSILDDTVSVSEDFEPYAFMQNSNKYGESMDSIFPNKIGRSKQEESKETSSAIKERSGVTPLCSRRSSVSSLSIIRRVDENSPKKVVKKLENSSAFTVRLTDFE